MNCAVIDIGANTIRLSIFAIDKSLPVLLFNKKQTAGLANYNDDGYLNKAGIETLISVLEKYKNILSYYPVDQTFVFATASLRNVINSSSIIKKVKNELKLKIDLLDSQEEANLGFLGISTSFHHLKTGMSVDIGGGSTEIVLFKDKEIRVVFGIDEGCLSLHKKFCNGVIPEKDEILKMTSYIEDKTWGFGDSTGEIDTISGIGGTIRSVGKVLKELDLADNKRCYDIVSMNKLYHMLLEKDSEAYDALLKVVPDRSHTLLCGLVILKRICELFDIKQVNASSYGLREGYVINQLNECDK